MEQEIDEGNKIIHVKCTEEEKSKIISELSAYLYDYQFNFIILGEQKEPYECRLGCGACCIAPSISSPIPGMPQGKPAGVRCIQLTEDNLCKLFGSPTRPAVCGSLRPSEEMCGPTNKEAFRYLQDLERETAVE